MSRTDYLFALFGKSVSRDPEGRNARLHFFGTVPFDDGTRVNQRDGSHYRSHPEERLQAQEQTVARPTVVAVVSINGGVGRSTLVTALSSGLQRLGESVMALDLDPQNALRHHFGVEAEQPGLGRASLLNAAWTSIVQSGFAGCQVIPFGDTDSHQKESLQRWLTREPKWLAQRLSALALDERGLVIIDTPAGNNVYLQQALSVADIVLVVTQPNAACLGTLDQVDALLAPCLERAPRCHIVINQMDDKSAFSLEMFEAFKQRLSDRPVHVIHHDPSISEALAFASDPLDNIRVSLAGDDINGLCRLLIARKKRP
ncbi:cellulose biosynthesis protein BcsQ [Pseudomonas trivialis]|uniref:Cell division protein FtsQ n=1 Tax=Pseudomonas trivialis TaxID=200450 RepID=A0A0R2ZGA4_9PSED|nr:cellulose biosynthesis protein BcsQ [Pseudomonas trivialis]KRP59818.1 cell division protein FtsQ [Pseudomonas trivialis]SDS16457.1 cellulose synthase operon protein YhjQ [Pseudomonas trivialis]